MGKDKRRAGDGRPAPVEHAPVRCQATSRSRMRNGVKEWYWRAKWMGSSNGRALGWIPEGPRGELVAEVRRRAVAALDAEPSRPQSVASESSEDLEPRSVGDLLDRWLTYRRSIVWRGAPRDMPRVRRGVISSLTLRNNEYQVGHLASWLDGHLITEVNDETLARYVVDRRHNDTSPSRSDYTLKEEISSLLAAWAWGKERGWTSTKLHQIIDPDPRKSVYSKYTPSMEEVSSVLALLDGDFRFACELLVWTGARVAEITDTLRCQDVDLSAGALQLLGKRQKVREVPIHPSHLDVIAGRLKARKPTDLLLWPVDMRPAPPSGHARRLRAKLKKTCPLAGVPHFSPHALRRLADDSLYDNVADPSTSSRIMGHSPKVAMDHYRTVKLNSMFKAMLDAGLGQLLVTGVKTGNVVAFPGAGLPSQIDLSSVSTEALMAELDKRRIGHSELGTVESSPSTTS